MEKYTFDNYSLVRVEALRSDVCLEFAFGHLGVMTAHASRLAQVESGVLIGQSAWRPLTLSIEVIDSTRTGASGSLHS